MRRSLVTLAPALLALLAAPVLAPAAAQAFCGFYVGGADAQLFNNATVVVLMREGIRTVLSMQNNYQGPPSGFAMVVPVPVVLQEANVKTLPKELFALVDQLAAPRLVEYWEMDPCEQEYRAMPAAEAPGMMRLEAVESDKPASLGVTIEAQFTVGEYEIVILSAKDSTGLDTWLRREKYAIPEGAEPLLRPYVEQGMKFFVAKVNPKKVTFDAQGQAMLSPLRFHYDSPEFRLPVRLGMINSAGTQDLLIHVLARGKRYELANYPNVTIPTNLDVDPSAKARFGEFYAALFDATLAKHAGAVVTEYAWDANTCDPCPGPTLSYSDLATLGADVVPGGGDFVLTRLHARYDKGALAEDLIFKEASPIVGGREWMIGEKVEKGSRADSYNNFQGRYAIRHAWAGKIACEQPIRGRWGGPPGESWNHPAPQAAKDLAFATRGKIELQRVVREDVPELGLMMAAADDRPPRPVEDAPKPAPAAEESAAPAPQGCACQTSETQGSSAALVLLLVPWIRRRRARARG
jgi:MYXO-CTERM domain-containing protein